jgi:hypothetical protein
MENFMDDYKFRQLLDRLGLSWQGYARVRKGVKKTRYPCHMQERGYQTMEDYLNELSNHEILAEVKLLMRRSPLAGKFQIIFLRNSLFTYYRVENTVPVFLKILERLDESGFFVIGRHEKLPVQTPSLVPYEDGCSYI